MKLKLSFIFCALFLLLVGCAGRSVQTETLLASHPNLPTSHLISNVPFIDQAADYCGPASLTMAMQSAGKNITIDQMAEYVYTTNSKGSYPTDLISASRRQGMMAIPINTLAALLTEVAGNHPVIVFENLGLSWAPKWHYSLVIGYDLNTKEIIRHSGHSPNERTRLKFFERSWNLADYWGLVVLPPNQLSITANERAHAAAAVGLEQVKKTNDAQIAYQTILQKWPTSLVALVGLGNLAYQKGDRPQAIEWLKRAVKAHPQSTAAQNNLDVALKK